ncbi:MAG: hypothetical protein EBU30_11050, partial [Synechococcaceae bacterium WB6_3B_236]|nr:hypothetical protein [Synechococcaceae bacterium WB6_3B_236]
MGQAKSIAENPSLNRLLRLGLFGLLLPLLFTITQVLPSLQRPGAAAPAVGLGGLVVLGFHEIAEPAQA